MCTNRCASSRVKPGIKHQAFPVPLSSFPPPPPLIIPLINSPAIPPRSLLFPFLFPSTSSSPSPSLCSAPHLMLNPALRSLLVQQSQRLHGHLGGGGGGSGKEKSRKEWEREREQGLCGSLNSNQRLSSSPVAVAMSCVNGMIRQCGLPPCPP